MKIQGIRIFQILSVVLLLVLLGTGEAHAQLFPIVDGASGNQASVGSASSGGPSITNAGNPAGLQSLLEALGTILILSGFGVGVVLLARKYFPGVIPGTDARMKILTRLPMGNRQNLVAFRVGERILVVAQSPNRVDLLSEICDPQEVQDLSYGTEFSREIERVHVETQDEEFPEQYEADSSDAGVREEIQWLRERLDGYGDRTEEEVHS